MPKVRSSRRILVVTPFEEPTWQWLAHYFPKSEFVWVFSNGNLFGKRQQHWLLHGWKAARRSEEFDLVVSHHPYMTLWTAFCLSMLRRKTAHIAFSFNHGNKRFFSGPILWLAKRALKNVSLFNVFSEGERHLYHRKYGLPLQIMRFSHWAVQPPRVPEPIPSEYSEFQPYICAIGRNNRDFDTLVKATEDVPINVVIVCSHAESLKLTPQKNIKVKYDLSLDECMQVLSGSLFSVVPLTDNSTGAGHMTFVHAMHLGKAQIVTDVANTKDYFFDYVHGIRIPPKDVRAMRGAIEVLIENAELRERFEKAAKSFAECWLSEPAAARSALEVFQAWADERPPELEPKGWSSIVLTMGHSESINSSGR